MAIVRLTTPRLAVIAAAVGVTFTARTATAQIDYNWHPRTIPVPQTTSIETRAQLLSAVLFARRGVLTDSTRLSSCGIYRVLGERADYLNLLHPAARGLVEVATPTPCSINPIWSDSTIPTSEQRRRVRAMHPSSVGVASIEQQGNGFLVGLSVGRPGYSYHEYHLVAPSPTLTQGAVPWQVTEITIRGIAVH